jgi:4-carboxymuconolactone decarboxylase
MSQMARIPGVSSGQAGPYVKMANHFARRSIGKLTGRETERMIEPLQMYAYVPVLFRGYVKLERATAKLHRLDRRLHALAELKAATLTHCEYCIDMGSVISRRWGLTDEEILALPGYQTSPLFSELDKLVLDYAVGMSRTPASVPGELLRGLRRHLDDGQIIELTHHIALENMRGRFNLALGIGSADFSDGMVCAVPAGLRPGAELEPVRKPGRDKCSRRCRDYSSRTEEVEHAPGEQCGGIGVVGRQRAVGEVVLVAGVEEQLGVLGLLDEVTGGVDVAFADEDWVGVHPVHLHRHPRGPGAERGDRDAGIEQQRPARSRPCLRQLLGREHAEREPGVYQFGGQPLHRPGPARDHLVGKADLLRVPHPLLEGGEGPALEQIGHVHGVAGAAQLLGEGDDAGGQSLRMVEEHYLGHGYPPCQASQSPVDCRKTSFLLLPVLPVKYRTMLSGYREDAPVTKTVTAAIGGEIGAWLTGSGWN